MVKQSNEVKKFYDIRFGELNIAISDDGQPMFCLTDVCRGLELLKREGDRIVKQSNCQKREFFVKRIKQIVSRTFVDESGFLTLVTESRKNKADRYRIWAIDLARGMERKTTAQKREATKKRNVDGKFQKMDEDTSNEDTEGPFPTLEEYFKDYVPVDYLIPLLSATLKDYAMNCRCESEEHRKEIEHRCSVLNTLNLTLIGNLEALRGHSKTNKTSASFLCK